MQTSTGSVLDFIDVPFNKSSGTSGNTIPWNGGGGEFSGGGSTGDWGAGEVVTEISKETVGSSVSGLVDDEGGAIVVLVIGGLFAAIIFGSGAYFIWHSPEILSECLIQVILVSGMRKRMKKFTEAEWISHMFKVTIWPFVIVLVFSSILGLGLRGFCPEANSFRDYKVQCWKSY